MKRILTIIVLAAACTSAFAQKAPQSSSYSELKNFYNASDYVYKLTAFGKDDTWTVNYSKRTVLMNNGSTEYSSDMFKDEYLAVWMVAIEEYYGIK